MTDLATILSIYAGSNGDATKALYASLEKRGPVGLIALNLFRACKASERAKIYRGRSYKGAAYDKLRTSEPETVVEPKPDEAAPRLPLGNGSRPPRAVVVPAQRKL